MLTFRTVEEAVSAIQEVEGDYVRHAKAARTIAEEYFDSDKVLSRVLERVLTSEGESVNKHLERVQDADIKDNQVRFRVLSNH